MTETILFIGGGVALILFGVRFLRKGLDRLFGASLRVGIQRLASRRMGAFFSGIGVAVIAPSSTTISVLAVQTIQAGHATSRQMLALMFGADIGMTVMIALLAFRLEQYAPVLLLAGIPLYQFTHQTRSRGIGQVIASLGFIFLGVLTIRNAARAYQPDEAFINLITAAGYYPAVIAAIFAFMAVALQSSTAAIALLIALAASNTIGITVAIAVAAVIGANIGVGLTTLLIGWKQIESRRLALGNLLAKVAVGLLMLIAIRPVAGWLTATQYPLATTIAISYTGFNVVLALIFVPLLNAVSWLTYRLAPDLPQAPQEKFGPKYIDARPIDSIALATGQSAREILRVAEIVRQMLTDLWRALKTADEQLNQQVSQRDDDVDQLDTLIKQYLTRLAEQGLDRDDAAEQMRQLRYINELETIGDIIDKNLSELVTKKIRKKVEFSDEGWRELDDFHGNVLQNMIIAETAFSTRDRMLAQQLLRHKQRIDQTERDLRDRHFQRLNEGMVQSHESSAIHLDLLTHLKRINSSVSHIAYAILQDTKGD